MYQPHNVTVIVVGSAMNPEHLLRTLDDEVEHTFIEVGYDNGPRPTSWIRPFVESSTASNPPTIPNNTRDEVSFPSKDETVGTITMSVFAVLYRPVHSQFGSSLAHGSVPPPWIS